MNCDRRAIIIIVCIHIPPGKSVWTSIRDRHCGKGARHRIITETGVLEVEPRRAQDESIMIKTPETTDSFRTAESKTIQDENTRKKAHVKKN
jgi:hypothetical protein